MEFPEEFLLFDVSDAADIKEPKWFQNIYIVPTVKGSYRVKCSIMCSEYLEPEEKIIDIEVV
jgi:hypothetical protein